MRLWFVIVATLLVACDSAEKQDAASVLEAIHRFRTAENDALPNMVEQLKATPCKFDDSCHAKQVCAALGDDTAKALRLKNEVELGLNAVEKGTLAKDSPEALSFEKKLDDAAALLKKGHDGLPECDAAVESLKRKYRL